MKKKMMKALRDLNAYIDDDCQKLCDRIHDLELSHKRMERLLKRVLDCLKLYNSENFSYTTSYLQHMIDSELHYPYFRANYKTKGEKNV